MRAAGDGRGTGQDVRSSSFFLYDFREELAGRRLLQAAEAAVLAVSTGPGELKTETVEEFISISDGQVMLLVWLSRGQMRAVSPPRVVHVTGGLGVRV